MFEVAHLPDGGITILKDESHLTRGEFKMGIFPFLCHQLTRRPSTPDDLTSLSNFQLNIVNLCSRGNIF